MLDEATSALDKASEKIILRAIDLLPGTVTIMVSHQMNTLKSCDVIFEINQFIKTVKL